ncbi:MAG: carbonic anhydrase [Candidatus Obscuribacterales bacterium]|nr:carbonic anhydrase [Candidatus Obscuribacterales bacterium]
MEKLLAGVHHFQDEIFSDHKILFEHLSSHGQRPETLFITCADSRINPNLLTQTGPGELFILRNAGNIIPPYTATGGGEAATIEFAIATLNIRDIIICGHSHCGAMKGLLHPEGLEENLPAVASWLKNCESVRRILKENYPGETDEKKLMNIATQENVLVQLEHLRTHPTVMARIQRKQLKVHGWIYKIETGDVFMYDRESGQFNRLTDNSGNPNELVEAYI